MLLLLARHAHKTGEEVPQPALYTPMSPPAGRHALRHHPLHLQPWARWAVLALPHCCRGLWDGCVV